MQRRILLVVVTCVLFGVVTEAHHSIAGVYDARQPKTVEAVVMQVRFINPHPFIVAVVKDDNGAEQEWRLEMDNRYELVAVGFTGDTLKQGDRIVVRGSLARTQPRSLYIHRLDRRSDGFWYEQVGASPKIGSRD